MPDLPVQDAWQLESLPPTVLAAVVPPASPPPSLPLPLPLLLQAAVQSATALGVGVGAAQIAADDARTRDIAAAIIKAQVTC